MSKLSTQPVLRCSQCGAPVKLAFLATTKSDINGELLMELFRGMAENALCDSCRQKLKYLNKEGRSDEWHPNRILIARR